MATKATLNLLSQIRDTMALIESNRMSLCIQRSSYDLQRANDELGLHRERLENLVGQISDTKIQNLVNQYYQYKMQAIEYKAESQEVSSKEEKRKYKKVYSTLEGKASSIMKQAETLFAAQRG